MSSQSQDVVADASVVPLTRPQLAEARRLRAAEMFEQRRPSSEVARAVGMHPESVRRWKRLWEQGGAQALLPQALPPAHALRVHPHTPAHLGRRTSLLEHLGRAQAPGLGQLRPRQRHNGGISNN
ncbi:helix-turn-helix domain-containing protein, partial [Streptomyces daliensis]|nr:helix-turn-helix domain-containing protein [Streptomyces daliensis]